MATPPKRLRGSTGSPSQERRSFRLKKVSIEGNIGEYEPRTGTFSRYNTAAEDDGGNETETSESRRNQNLLQEPFIDF